MNSSATIAVGIVLLRDQEKVTTHVRTDRQDDRLPGQRDALIAILFKGTTEMPGCLSYIVATDPEDENAIWISEVWDAEASHKASLALPAVQAAIAKARPIIAGFGERFITTPVGGVGLTPAP